MSDNKTLFDMASLAEAAYADFFQGRILKTCKADALEILKATGWSATQATEFLTRYRVISQQPKTATGYSGTLFERLDEAGSATGEYVFSQRGTEPLVQAGAGAPFGLDIAVDIGDLVADGLAWSQTVDKYNYWKEFCTPKGQTYQKAILAFARRRCRNQRGDRAGHHLHKIQLVQFTVRKQWPRFRGSPSNVKNLAYC